MKLEKDDVVAAAFWDMDVCLDCPAIVNAEEGVCPACGNPTIACKTVLKVFDVVEDPEQEA